MQYFKSKSTLPTTGYWFGLSANASGGPGYSWLDGTPVHQNYSVEPYAHWSWSYHTKLAGGSSWPCVVARGKDKYDYFIGEGTQLSNKAFYSATLDDKYGWDLEVSEVNDHKHDVMAA